MSATSNIGIIKKLADKLDSQIRAAALNAERETSHKVYRYPLSPSLAEAGKVSHSGELASGVPKLGKIRSIRLLPVR